ncbi:MAG: hypothetical protein HY304_02285, partial [candidate division Zixibacteria bacterium]|nr:hypothetical protein [candidate division Zixibacteria bacterium]
MIDPTEPMNPSDLPRIVSVEQMRAIDQRAIERMGIPGLTMMENAGRGMAERIREGILGGHCRDMKIAIVCGRGNNGGDG